METYMDGRVSGCGCGCRNRVIPGCMDSGNAQRAGMSGNSGNMPEMGRRDMAQPCPYMGNGYPQMGYPQTSYPQTGGEPAMGTGSDQRAFVWPVANSPNTAASHLEQNYPVAMAYVPWQQWQTTYAPEQGLMQGTIFPDLDLQFNYGRCGR